MKSIPAPEPNLTPAEMIARADALRPVLRARQACCESLGHLPDETHSDFMKAGFYRAVQPRRFGGYEFDLPTFARMIINVARGCSESGWVLALVAGHGVFIARYPEQAQIEAFGDTGEFRGPGVAPPGGQAARVDGGYRVQGAWDYSSGIVHGTHFMGTCIITDPGTKTPQGSAWFLFDREHCAVVDNWNVFGMQGTGSRRVVVSEMFLPEYRLWMVTDEKGQRVHDNPAAVVHKNPMYCGRMLPWAISELAAVAIGAARGALDVYEEMLKAKRNMFPPFQLRFEEPEFQRHFGLAQAWTDTAEAAFLHNSAEYMEAARKLAGGVPWTDEQERRMVMVLQQCVRLAWDAVELLFRTSGSSSANAGSALGRYFRNLAVVQTHVTLQFEHSAAATGRVHFGLPALRPL
jgi:3-hydroxy-9,10-secoandrosta-1,3,5(10)-triene-9,17-dione monooxygenase